MKLTSGGLLALAGILVLGACDIGTPAPTNGGDLSVALASDPATLNPFVAGDAVSQRALAPLFPLLYQVNSDLTVTPDLAAGLPAISDDHKIWTVKLRHGARWTDGKEITATDVVGTVTLQRDPRLATDALFDWTALDKVERVDDYTVRFTLAQVYAPFLARSLATFVAPAHIYGAIDAARMRDDSISQEPTVGGGPFKFQKRVKGSEVDLVANTTYYAGRPHFDRLFEKVLPDASTRANALADGKVLWEPDLNGDAVDKLQHAGGLKVWSYPDLGYYDVRFNDRADHLFGDKLVRQAFAYAIDKEAVVRQATSSHGTTLWGDIVPTSWAYDAGATTRYKKDVARSRDLLKQAGWTPGADGILEKAGKRFQAKLLVRQDAPTRVRAADLVSAQVRQVGIDLTPTATDYSVFFDPLKTGTFDIALTGFSTSPDPDPFLTFHSSQLRPEASPTGVNWTGYSNPQLDRLIDSERATLLATDRETRVARKRIFAEIEKILSDDVVTYFLWTDNNAQGLSTRINGVRGGPGGSLLGIDHGFGSSAFAGWYLKQQ